MEYIPGPGSLAPFPRGEAAGRANLEADCPRFYWAVGVLGSFRCNAALRGGLPSLEESPGRSLAALRVSRQVNRAQ